MPFLKYVFFLMSFFRSLLDLSTILVSLVRYWGEEAILFGHKERRITWGGKETKKKSITRIRQTYSSSGTALDWRAQRGQDKVIEAGFLLTWTSFSRTSEIGLKCHWPWLVNLLEDVLLLLNFPEICSKYLSVRCHI